MLLWVLKSVLAWFELDWTYILDWTNSESMENMNSSAVKVIDLGPKLSVGSISVESLLIRSIFFFSF